MATRVERIYQYIPERSGDEGMIPVGYVEYNDDGSFYLNLDAVPLKGRLFVRPMQAAPPPPRSPGRAGPPAPPAA